MEGTRGTGLDTSSLAGMPEHYNRLSLAIGALIGRNQRPDHGALNDVGVWDSRKGVKGAAARNAIDHTRANRDRADCALTCSCCAADAPLLTPTPEFKGLTIAVGSVSASYLELAAAHGMVVRAWVLLRTFARPSAMVLTSVCLFLVPHPVFTAQEDGGAFPGHLARVPKLRAELCST